MLFTTVWEDALHYLWVFFLLDIFFSTKNSRDLLDQLFIISPPLNTEDKGWHSSDSTLALDNTGLCIDIASNVKEASQCYFS